MMFSEATSRLLILALFLSSQSSSRPFVVVGFSGDVARKGTHHNSMLVGRRSSSWQTTTTTTTCQPPKSNVVLDNIINPTRSSIRESSHVLASTVTQPDDYDTATLSSSSSSKQTNNNSKEGIHHHHHHHRSATTKHSKQRHYKIRSNDDDKKKKKEKIRQMFRDAKTLERKGQWLDATLLLRDILNLDPHDSYSHLALARLESRRERRRDSSSNNNSGGSKKKKESSSSSLLTADETHHQQQHSSSSSPSLEEESPARKAFEAGTILCPQSIHLWQAWALYEQSHNNYDKATELFHKALQIDDSNPYVCHAFGLFQQRVHSNHTAAQELWNRPLNKNRSSAALVCSLGESLVSCGKVKEAKQLYATQVHNLQKNERELTEVFLAAAWLEEKKLHNMDKAVQLIKRALTMNPRNSRALVALARLEGRRWEQNERTTPQDDDDDEDVLVHSKHAAMRNNFKKACKMLERDISAGKITDNDGRLFNVWAKMEVQAGSIQTAREILRKGITLFRNDHSLLQAAGKVEERLGNFTGARDLFSASLHIEPSAPTLVAFAMLEIRDPEDNDGSSKKRNLTKVVGLFEEALLLDPRHGPAYNAYGNMELRRNNIEKARQIYHRGIQAQCSDAASVYHGLARLELSLGNVEIAREILIEGLNLVDYEGMMENKQHSRAAFLAHTLGMLELKSNRAAVAKEVFDDAIERHGYSSQLLLGAALCQVKLGNEDAARRLFEKAVNLDKKHAQAWQSWGVMEMRAGNYNTAKTLFECGIQSVPRHGALWQAYATMENQRGNIEVARTLFAAGVTKCKNHVPLYQAWACLELRQRQYLQAKKLIGEALTRDKTQGSGWRVAAKIEEKQGNMGLVGMILKRGLQCAPNDAELYCAVAEYEFNRGKIDSAREFLEKGLEVDPLYAPLYHKLAELEAQVFNLEGLAQLNKRAAEVFNNNALVPPPASMQAWGKKIRMARPNARLPKNVAALAGMVNENDELEQDALNEMDPDLLIQTMPNFEDDVVGDIFQENNEDTSSA